MQGIVWFTKDLRLNDNKTLATAAREFSELACIFIIDPKWFEPNRFNCVQLGKHRWHFLIQSLIELDNALKDQGQYLQVFWGNPLDIVSKIVKLNGIRNIYHSASCDYNLNRIWKLLGTSHTDINWREFNTHTLFDIDQLPFNLSELPDTFSKFRKPVEQLNIASPIDRPAQFPKPLNLNMSTFNLYDIEDQRSYFQGGWSHGQRQLDSYFSGDYARHYFNTRNSLTGWSNSTKFSPWLANGCLSAKQIIAALNFYESQFVQNKSTYWIFV